MGVFEVIEEIPISDNFLNAVLLVPSDVKDYSFNIFVHVANIYTIVRALVNLSDAWQQLYVYIMVTVLCPT